MVYEASRGHSVASAAVESMAARTVLKPGAADNMAGYKETLSVKVKCGE